MMEASEGDDNLVLAACLLSCSLKDKKNVSRLIAEWSPCQIHNLEDVPAATISPTATS